MANDQIVKLLYEIAQYYAIKDDIFRSRAYSRAARSIESLDEDIDQIYRRKGKKGLIEITSIGEGIAEDIEEYLIKGDITTLSVLKREEPVDVTELSKIEGIGPKMIKVLFDRLKIKNLKDLEAAAANGQLRNLPGFGPKKEENILRSINLSKEYQGRFLLGYILPIVESILAELKKSAPVSNIIACGSIRRMKETVGDIDILATSKHPKEVIKAFTELSGVEAIIEKGETRSSVRLGIGIDADLRIVDKNSFGSAVMYFTGNKDHNIKLRKIAQKRGWKLNEYGLFGKNNHLIASKEESDIYKKLGISFIPPEMREDRGEIELAQKDKLPKIVDYDEVLGDLHLHTSYSDGSHSIEEIVAAAKKIGRKYIAIADHVGNLKIAGAMNESAIYKQWKEIEQLKMKIKGIEILKGCEVDINADGSLALPDTLLSKFDIVLAAVHSKFKMQKLDMTRRIVRAIENPHVDIISHPTGRIIQRRIGYAIDIDKIFAVAKKSGIALEINCYPDRLDLNDIMAKKAAEAGAMLSLGTDSHTKNQLENLKLGIAVARRAWVKKENIINCFSFGELLSWLKKRRKLV